MKRLQMLLGAVLLASVASAASAGDARMPTTTDEVRALAGRHQVDASPTQDCGRMPTSTDEARAAAGARHTAAPAMASQANTTERRTGMPTSTDEARALAAAATNERAAASGVRRADACTTHCACPKGERHASGHMQSCACHGHT